MAENEAKRVSNLPKLTELEERTANDWLQRGTIRETSRGERELSVTFAGLRDAVDRMDHGTVEQNVFATTLATRLDDVLDRARINADDTVYVEKAAVAAEWDRIALDTVSDILSQSGTDGDIVEWFLAQGVRF